MVTYKRALSAWGAGFPRGYGHTSIAFLKRCPGYDEAKAGDMYAARYVVHRCVKSAVLSQLCERHSSAMLLPVMGRNALPLALAQTSGLPVWRGVFLVKTSAPQKELPALQRLLFRPAFIGTIDKGRDYIIVDDIVTQGSTISALRQFVVARGGNVVAVTALAFAAGSYQIAPTRAQMLRFLEKFGKHIPYLQAMGVIDNAEAMTSSQIKYLLRFDSATSIYTALVKASAPYSYTISKTAFSEELTLFSSLGGQRARVQPTCVDSTQVG